MGVLLKPFSLCLLTFNWLTPPHSKLKMLYSHLIHLHAETWGHNKNERHSSFRKIYLSLYLKGLCVRGSWRPNRTATYWPPLAITTFLSRSPGLLNWGPRGPVSLGAGFLYHILSPTATAQPGGLRAHSAGCWLSLPHLVSNWLNFPCIELYNSSTPSFFLWASQIALIQPVHGQGYPAIPWPNAPVIYTGAFPILTARPGQRSIYNKDNYIVIYN